MNGKSVQAEKTAAHLTMNEIGFDYGGLPTVEVAALRAQAQRIRKSNRLIMSTILQVGRELIDIKARLPHGRFRDWVEIECGLNARTAERYVGAARFAEGKNDTVSHLAPAVV